MTKRNEVRGPNVPDALAETDDWKTFAELSGWVKAAMVAGTVTRHDETCLAWLDLSLDRQGWEKVLASLKRLHTFIVKEQELAEVRLRSGDGEPIAIVVGLGAFETPPPTKEF
jgi:hypothetical protein